MICYICEIFRITWMLDLVERRTSLYEGLPLMGSNSVADVAATKDWATALVRKF